MWGGGNGVEIIHFYEVSNLRKSNSYYNATPQQLTVANHTTILNKVIGRAGFFC